MELAKLWRTDKYLRKLDVRYSAMMIAGHSSFDFGTLSYSRTTSVLQAVMVVADAKQSLTITGNGDVLEPHDGIIGGTICMKHDCCYVLWSRLVCAQLLTFVFLCSNWIRGVICSCCFTSSYRCT